MPVKKINPLKIPATKFYGLPFVEGKPQYKYDREAFAWRVPLSKGTPPRYELFQSLADALIPGYFEWHEWTEKMIRALVAQDATKIDGKVRILCGFPGCSNSAKTRNIAGFATIWWLADPWISSVCFVSTTVKSLRRRGWAEVQRAYSSIPGPRVGNFIDSRMIWQMTKGDDKQAIIGRAVEEGSSLKVADDIKGVHTRRQMIIIDEATAVPEAILIACSNLYSYPDEFILCLLGNPYGRLDQFGRFCEPANGWLSVSVDSGEWDAKPFEMCGGIQPRVITFDAEKSPNIVEGRTVSKHLPKKEQVESARRASGGGKTPHYWQNMRGFWPPEGLTKTVFTESALVKFEAKKEFRFTGQNFIIIGALDPAYGGDRPALRFGKLGLLDNGMMGLQALPPIVLEINAEDSNPIHYQLLEQVRANCEKIMIGPYQMSCAPENFGLDDTGEGGLSAIMSRNWSNRVIRVEFGGKASEQPASLEDIRPAREVYSQKRAEMYFFARHALDSGQLRGIDDETGVELCNLEYELRGGKYLLMSKKDYKEKYKSSPDFADSLVILVEVARSRGFVLSAVGQTAMLGKQVDEEVEKTQEVFAEEHAYQEEEVEELTL